MALVANVGRGGLLGVALVSIALGGCGGDRPLLKPAQARPASDGAAGAPPFGDAGASGGGGAGVAGTTGRPPPVGAGGAAGEIVQGGAGGQAGLAGVAPPPSTYCELMPKKPLPYAIGPDFTFLLVLNAPSAWTVADADCNQEQFLDVPAAAVGGGDGGSADGARDGAVVDGAGRRVSSCVAFKYAPDACVATVDGSPSPDLLSAAAIAACWAGVIFTPTPTALNGAGICIAPGATAIHFKARASRAGARVKFGALRPGLGQTELFLALSTDWADYTVFLPAGDDYHDGMLVAGSGVWNGFSIVAEPQDHSGGTYILVSDVVWSAE